MAQIPSDASGPAEPQAHSAPLKVIPTEALAAFMSDSTCGGLFPAIAFGMDPDGSPSTVGLLTSPIVDLPVALELVERVHDKEISPYRFIPLKTIKYIADKNAIMKCHVREISGLDTKDPEHRKAFSRLMAYCTASRWKSRAFALIDMVGFSLASTPEQLSMRMSLGQSVNQVSNRMYPLGLKGVIDSRASRGFNRTSTGDGFYIWSYDGSTEGHVANFVLLVLLMTQVEAMRSSGASELQLRAAFAIGEAYTFPYHGPSVPPPLDTREGFMPDAIGPVLNKLSRLLTAAAPGQLLVAPFNEPGRVNRPGEKLDVNTMLMRVRSEILPAELDPKDPIKAQDIVLECDPKTPLRVTDKHQEVHHCFNVWGKIPNRLPPLGLQLQSFGVINDEAAEVANVPFRSP